MIQIEQKKFTYSSGWQCLRENGFEGGFYQLVLAFGSTRLMENPEIYRQISQNYPNAEILMNSTAGEIFDIEVNDESVSLVAIRFEKSQFKTVSVHIENMKDSWMQVK